MMNFGTVELTGLKITSAASSRGGDSFRLAATKLRNPNDQSNPFYWL